jgi:isoleucyl-tRNA synthetase
MSKSLGNTISPIDLMRDYGADILRLWALSVDFTEDHRIGKEILAGVADQYRKLRNTFRYLLGALEGFDESERVTDVAAMPELERYMLALLADLDAKLAAAVDDFDFNAYTRLLADFCNEDLSAFYFDIRKDRLYCDVNPATGAQTAERAAYRTVLDTLFHALVRYAAPVLVFTSEEVWGTRYPDAGSVHLLEWPQFDPAWNDILLVMRWMRVRLFRDEIIATVEPLRREKIVGSGLAADIDFRIKQDFDEEVFRSVDLAELAIVASVTLDPERLPADDEIGFAATAQQTENHKCGRCWRHLPEVTEDGGLCNRCETVLDAG